MRAVIFNTFIFVGVVTGGLFFAALAAWADECTRVCEIPSVEEISLFPEDELGVYMAYKGSPAPVYFMNEINQGTVALTVTGMDCLVNLAGDDEIMGYVVYVAPYPEGNPEAMFRDEAGYPTQIYYGVDLLNLEEISQLWVDYDLGNGYEPCRPPMM